MTPLFRLSRRAGEASGAPPSRRRLPSVRVRSRVASWIARRLAARRCAARWLPPGPGRARAGGGGAGRRPPCRRRWADAPGGGGRGGPGRAGGRAAGPPRGVGRPAAGGGGPGGRPGPPPGARPSLAVEPWTVAPDLEPGLDRLHFLVWANTYDARAGRRRCGGGAARPSGSAPGRSTTAGPATWCSPTGAGPGSTAGPAARSTPTALGAERRAPRVGRPRPPPGGPAAAAPDGRARPRPAGGGGPPGGAGPDHRPRRLGQDPGAHRAAPPPARRPGLGAASSSWPSPTTRRPARSCEERCAGLRRPGADAQLPRPPRAAARPGAARPGSLDEREVRRELERPRAPGRRRRANTDPLAALPRGPDRRSASGLRDPAEVEAERDDVPGPGRRLPPLPGRAAATRARSTSTSRSTGPSRRCSPTATSGRGSAPRTRHLLVDEFQDLTPGPRAAPAAAGRCPASTCSGWATTTRSSTATPAPTPASCIDFDALFPGAGVAPARGQLPLPGGGRRRRPHPARRTTTGGWPRRSAPGPAPTPRPSALRVDRHPAEAGGHRRWSSVVQGWLAERRPPPTASPCWPGSTSLLLAPTWPWARPASRWPRPSAPRCSSAPACGRRWPTCASAPTRTGIAGADVVEVLRRPSRGLPPWFRDRVAAGRRWSLRALRAMRPTASTTPRSRPRCDELVDDLEVVVGAPRAAAPPATPWRPSGTRSASGGPWSMLDGSKGGPGGRPSSTTSRPCAQVAALHPDAGALRALAAGGPAPRPPTPGGRHRSRPSTGSRAGSGTGWSSSASPTGLLPHRLAEDVEEERRVLHVAITRGRRPGGGAGRRRPAVALPRRAGGHGGPRRPSGRRRRRPGAGDRPAGGPARGAHGAARRPRPGPVEEALKPGGGGGPGPTASPPSSWPATPSCGRGRGPTDVAGGAGPGPRHRADEARALRRRDPGRRGRGLTRAGRSAGGGGGCRGPAGPGSSWWWCRLTPRAAPRAEAPWWAGSPPRAASSSWWWAPRTTGSLGTSDGSSRAVGGVGDVRRLGSLDRRRVRGGVPADGAAGRRGGDHVATAGRRRLGGAGPGRVPAPVAGLEPGPVAVAVPGGVAPEPTSAHGVAVGAATTSAGGGASGTWTPTVLRTWWAMVWAEPGRAPAAAMPVLPASRPTTPRVPTRQRRGERLARKTGSGSRATPASSAARRRRGPSTRVASTPAANHATSTRSNVTAAVAPSGGREPPAGGRGRPGRAPLADPLPLSSRAPPLASSW